MTGPFEFDQKKTAQENIADFLSHVESIDKAFAGLLRKNIGKMLPLPEVSNRGSARAAFNREIMRQLDAALAAAKGKNG